MHSYADIVFPTAVRQAFTYKLPPKMAGSIQKGMRVWVPFQRRKAIGVVVRLHSEAPDFNTRAIHKVLDHKPILSQELLDLTQWMHRFYYCGWGDVIQAALPAGINFRSQQKLKIISMSGSENLPDDLCTILVEVKERAPYLLKEAEKRWTEGQVQQLIKRGFLEIWEEPKLKVKPSTARLWEWADEKSSGNAEQTVQEYARENKKFKWIRALEILLKMGLPEFQKNLTKHDLLDSYTLNRIADEGLISSRQVESTDISFKYKHAPSQIKTLNKEQQKAHTKISSALDEADFASFLLYGVTGSGKTEVYIHALKKALKQGKGGMVLVPEIGLTPQIVQRFYQIFGDQIAVIHSRLTMRERFDAWRALQTGKKKIVIGARSAVFAPVQNLGLIIVDEEHDGSYKQENPAPRYHARDVAIMRAALQKAVVVMGSATPSMVTLQGARSGKSQMLTLKERPHGATLPDVEVLDLKKYKSAMRGPIAVPLFNHVQQALERDEQAILLYNRRGYSSFLQCQDCGAIPECPNCSVSLTYHKAKNQLRCHYCGYAVRNPDRCAACNQSTLEPAGSGTQQLEEAMGKLFPDARLLRMDYDTTSGREAHANILSKFARKEADILVGTQIVGKGLNFPDVTVVGVINADTELAFPSFRASERMFQLLSQVAGRSGRAKKKGTVFFQTWKPDHPALKAARYHDYEAFAEQELSFRENLKYPPYSRLIQFIFKGKQEHRVQKVSRIFTKSLIDSVGGADSVLGPSPAAIAKVQQYYRWETLLKIAPSNGANVIEKMLDHTFDRYETLKPKNSSSVRINVNVDALE